MNVNNDVGFQFTPACGAGGSRRGFFSTTASFNSLPLLRRERWSWGRAFRPRCFNSLPLVRQETLKDPSLEFEMFQFTPAREAMLSHIICP